MRTKRISIVALFVAMVAAFTMLFVTNAKVAKADPATFAFEEGAYVKLNGDGGLRFRLQMDEETATEIQGNANETLLFYVASAARMEEVTTGTQAKALNTAGNAWEVTADKEKIYAGEDENGDPDGFYYANVLIDANNIGADDAAKLAYRTTDFVAAATVYDSSSSSYTSFVKSVERSMKSTASAGALRGGYFDDVTTVYSWLGSSENYAIVAANAADYTALTTALTADDSLYFYLDGVADTENLCATYAAHSGISDLGVMKTIIPTVTNGGMVYDTANEEYTATATADNMYVFVSHNAVTAYGEGKDYVKLVVSSSAGASFTIVPMNDDNAGSDGNWSYIDFHSLYSAETYYIPLNDTEVHDWSKYDLRLYVGYNTQVLKIEEISFKTEAEYLEETAKTPAEQALEIFVADDSWGTKGGATRDVFSNTENSVTVGGWYFCLTADAVTAIKALGFDKVTFTVNQGKSLYTWVELQDTYYAPGSSVTIDLRVVDNQGRYPMRMSTNGTSIDSGGAVTITNIVFGVNPPKTSAEQALEIFVADDSWGTKGGATRDIFSNTANSVTVGGWYFCLTADAVTAIRALGFDTVTFTVNEGGSLYTWVELQDTYYAPGSSVTIDLRVVDNQGRYPIRMSTNGTSIDSGGAVTITNIVFG